MLPAWSRAVPGLGVSLVGASAVFVRRAWGGGGVRAVSHDAEVAALAGIPVRRIVVLSFAASGLLAGLAGIMVLQITRTVEARFCFHLVIPGFVAAGVGGMGRNVGALIRGSALGVAGKLA